MAMSKSFDPRKCRMCLVCLSRKYNSSANADGSLLHKRLVQLRKMSVNQWKVVTQLKDQLNKTSWDKNNIMLVVNREWINVLKKLPSISGQIPAMKVEKPVTKAHSTYTVTDSLPNIYNDLKSRFSQSTVPQVPLVKSPEKPKWKTKIDVVSDVSIKARTKYILHSLDHAELPTTLAKRLDNLIQHLQQYPESVNQAIKMGAVRTLLVLRARTKECDEHVVAGSLREALTVLGYVEPPKNRGIRILAIDGGGIRGLVALEMMKKLETLTGKSVCDLFDYVCGVSTGSILTCAFGCNGMSLNECSELYKELAHKIFTQNAFNGAKALLWSHGYYDTALWEQMLQQYLGDCTLIQTCRKKSCPKIGAISAVIVQDQVAPFIFRNYELPYRIRSPYLGSSKHKVWEAARASAAAPTYFEEFRLGNLLHQDGGIFVNNPTAVAVHEARQLWPDSPIQCVVSLGTGRKWPLPSRHMDEAATHKELTKQASWKEKFYQILVSATDTEAVHTMLNDLLPPSVYFRFNPYLTEMLSMVEYQTEKLQVLEQDAAMYMRRNEEKFQEAANSLSQAKPKTQQLKEWMALQAAIYGFK